MNRSKLFLIVILILAVAVTAGAALPDNAEEVTTHLEFMGYDVEASDEALIADHEENLTIFVRDYENGILLTALFDIKEGQGADCEFFKLVNEFNYEATASRYYVDSDGDLVMEGYFPGKYERKKFGVFMEAFNGATAQLVNHGDELLKYLE